MQHNEKTVSSLNVPILPVCVLDLLTDKQMFNNLKRILLGIRKSILLTGENGAFKNKCIGYLNLFYRCQIVRMRTIHLFFQMK